MVRSEARGWNHRDRKVTCTRTGLCQLCSQLHHHHLKHSRYFKIVFHEWMEWLNDGSYKILTQFLKRHHFQSFIRMLSFRFREPVNFWGMWIKYSCLGPQWQHPPFILKHDFNCATNGASKMGVWGEVPLPLVKHHQFSCWGITGWNTLKIHFSYISNTMHRVI